MVTGRLAVAASSQRTDADGVREPWGDMHAWRVGGNQTLCGLALSRSRLSGFAHVLWSDAMWMVESASERPREARLCPRCRAIARRGHSKRPNWRRHRPRP